MRIKVFNNDINKAMRILKKKLQNEGDLKAFRESEFFVSKSQKERLAKKAGAKRWAKKKRKIEKQMIINEQRLIRKNRKPRPSK